MYSSVIGIKPDWREVTSGNSTGSFALRRAPELKRARVVVADDHALVLERVASLLTPLFDIVGTATNGSELVVEVYRLQPDVVVLDITMPMLTGIEAAQELRRGGCLAKLVFLSVHEDPALLHACFAEGALGYVTKARLATDLVSAVTEALSGHRFISPSLMR